MSVSLKKVRLLNTNHVDGLKALSVNGLRFSTYGSRLTNVELNLLGRAKRQSREQGSGLNDNEGRGTKTITLTRLKNN